MNRRNLAAAATLCLSTFGALHTSYAKPNAAAPAPSAATGKTVTFYYKPSIGGVDSTVYANDKAGATLKCLTAIGQYAAERTQTVVMSGGKAYCKRTSYSTHALDVVCAPGATLVPESAIPAELKSTFGRVDQCRKAGAPPNVAGSYLAAICQPGWITSGYAKVVKDGADKCEKNVPTDWVQMPGLPENAQVASNPTQADLDVRSVSCPPNATLMQEANGVYCKKN